MKYWTFKVYINKCGENEFEIWKNSLDSTTRQKIGALLRRMETIPRWRRPFFDKIHGSPKLHEIIVKGANNVPHRLLGCFNPGVRKEFILLIGAKKKNGNYTPNNPYKIATDKIKLINKEGRIDEY